MNEQHRVTAVWVASVLSFLVAGCSSADDAVDSHLGSGAGGDTGSSGAASNNAGAPGSSGTSVMGAAGGSVGSGGTGGSGDVGGAGMGGESGGGGNAGGGAGNRPPDGGARLDAGSIPSADGGPPSNAAVDALCTPKVVYMNQFPNTTGGMRFDKAVPDVTATMQATSRTVCRYIFRKPEDVHQNAQVTVVIDNHDGVAETGGARIAFSANYIGGIPGNDAAIAFEVNGVLAHEDTHIWQWANGGGGALVEAMADYVRYRSGYDKLSRRHTGGNWSDPYTVGGFFIVWVEDKYDKDWGYKINMGMKDPGFSYPKFIQDTFGKSADALWAEYQADIK